MRVTPVSAEQANANSFEPWPPGVYDFEVSEATEEISANQNEMVKLVLFVFNRDSQRRMVFDYLVAGEKTAYKVRHFAEATGLLAYYERGDMPADRMVGKIGRCRLKIDKQAGYADKNSVQDYVAQDGVQRAAPASRTATPAARVNPRATAPAGDIDDDIPF